MADRYVAGLMPQEVLATTLSLNNTGDASNPLSETFRLVVLIFPLLTIRVESSHLQERYPVISRADVQHFELRCMSEHSINRRQQSWLSVLPVRPSCSTSMEHRMLTHCCGHVLQAWVYSATVAWVSAQHCCITGSRSPHCSRKYRTKSIDVALRNGANTHIISACKYMDIRYARKSVFTYVLVQAERRPTPLQSLDALQNYTKTVSLEQITSSLGI